jgi:hypothetical protein
MDDMLPKRYLEYTSPEEATAGLFVKNQIDNSKENWETILDCRRHYGSEDLLHFKVVTGRLCMRRLQQQHLSRSTFGKVGRLDERKHYLEVRAITREAAHRHIEQQG